MFLLSSPAPWPSLTQRLEQARHGQTPLEGPSYHKDTLGTLRNHDGDAKEDFD